jgi:hypothetical protein
VTLRRGRKQCGCRRTPRANEPETRAHPLTRMGGGHHGTGEGLTHTYAHHT